MTDAIPARLRRLVIERACSLCEYLVRLYHPRQDCWADHFHITGARIVPLTDIGEATVQLLSPLTAMASAR